MPTAADLRSAVIAALDAWDGPIRVDIDVDGCRVQLADLGTRKYVEYMAVPEALRRCGYGTAILAAVTAWADRNGIALELGVSTDYGMCRAVLERLYRAHGFHAADRRGGMIRQPATPLKEDLAMPAAGVQEAGRVWRGVSGPFS